MDKIFGTFRDKLKESGTSYKGGSEEKVDTKTTSIHDRKASLSSEKNVRIFVCLYLDSTTNKSMKLKTFLQVSLKWILQSTCSSIVAFGHYFGLLFKNNMALMNGAHIFGHFWLVLDLLSLPKS